MDHQLVVHDEQQAREDGHACEPEVAREAILVHDASTVGTARYYEDDDGLNQPSCGPQEGHVLVVSQVSLSNEVQRCYIWLEDEAIHSIDWVDVFFPGGISTNWESCENEVIKGKKQIRENTLAGIAANH